MISVIFLQNNINELLSLHNVSNLVKEILISQDLNYEQVKQILEDEKYELQSDDLDNIINRLYKAKALNEKVVIVGDYDADGIMSTVILYKAFKRFGLEVGFYIPNRLSEGYGINKSIVKNISDKGYSLIITVDNGIVAFDALDYAKDLGIEVIVTDHHHYADDNDYDFDYLLHPKRLSNGYNELAGAGLALVVADKLLNSVDMGEYYIYAMIATIADMVSVFGFNRNIIKNGLYFLNKNGNKYVDNLIHYRNGSIDQQVISFQVVPKLNTFGRMADLVNVNNMVRYFLLEDSNQIEIVSKDIQRVNQERIDLTRKTFDENEDIRKYGSLNILVADDIHEGITGLIAGRFLNKLNEPTLVLTKVDDLYKGSGRAPKGYDIHSVLNNLTSYFESFGGHKQACGISFKANRLDYILNTISVISDGIDFEKISDPFLNVSMNDINEESVKEFNSLEPYGVDFIKPKLKVDLNIELSPTVLKEKYLKWSIGNNIELLSFNNNGKFEEIKLLDHISAYVDLSLNEFRGKTTVNMIVSEFLLD